MKSTEGVFKNPTSDENTINVFNYSVRTNDVLKVPNSQTNENQFIKSKLLV